MLDIAQMQSQSGRVHVDVLPQREGSETSSFEDSLKQAADGVNHLDLDTHVLPPYFRGCIEDVLNDRISTLETTDAVLEKLKRAFDIFVRNIEIEPSDRDLNMERLQLVSLSMVQLVVQFAHEDSLAGLLDQWSVLNKHPALSDAQDIMTQGFSHLFEVDTLEMTAYQKMRLDYVSYHEKRSMTVQFQHTVWQYFKQHGHDDMIGPLADQMTRFNPEIEADIVQDSPLRTGLSAVPSVDMGFGDS